MAHEWIKKVWRGLAISDGLDGMGNRPEGLWAVSTDVKKLLVDLKLAREDLQTARTANVMATDRLNEIIDELKGQLNEEKEKIETKLGEIQEEIKKPPEKKP